MVEQQQDHPGSRVVCISEGHLLLVEHEDPADGIRYWVLPGGGREPGETQEECAVRETFEETGLRIRIGHRISVLDSVGMTNVLFVAEPIAHLPVAPTVLLESEVYLRGARWWPVTEEDPTGPLDSQYFGFLAPLISWLLKGSPDDPPPEVQVLLLP